MSAAAVAVAGGSEAAALRTCVEDRVVPRLLGSRSPVARIDRTAMAGSSYGAYAVAVELSDGRSLRLFLKDYGTSRRPRGDLRERRERELGVYREVLPGAGLGTARHLGEVWDDERGWHWLLLEHVAGPLLRDLEPERWIKPLEWLGRLHGRFAGAWDDTATPAFLERRDERFFRAAAERALGAVDGDAPSLLPRTEALLQGLGDVLAGPSGGPRTLVHGAFLAANVIVAPGEQARTCVVDWERAAVGSPFHDLATFCDGFEAPMLARMLAAYRRGARAGGLELPPDEELVDAIDRCRLQRVVEGLAAGEEKRYSRQGYERLVSRGERLCALLEERA